MALVGPNPDDMKKREIMEELDAERDQSEDS